MTNILIRKMIRSSSKGLNNRRVIRDFMKDTIAMNSRLKKKSTREFCLILCTCLKAILSLSISVELTSKNKRDKNGRNYEKIGKVGFWK